MKDEDKTVLKAVVMSFSKNFRRTKKVDFYMKTNDRFALSQNRRLLFKPDLLWSFIDRAGILVNRESLLAYLFEEMSARYERITYKMKTRIVLSIEDPKQLKER